MIRRVAALFALFAFAAAWLVGVLCGHAPLARLGNAAIALASGLLAGIGVGVALERIVLVRLAEQWQERGTPPAANARAGATAKAAAPPAASDAPPAAPLVARNAGETLAAAGEAKR